jgi:transposase-like protein
MKKRYTEEQTIAAVKKLEAGMSAKDLSREMGVSQQTL